jgi:hypothetical protein
VGFDNAKNFLTQLEDDHSLQSELNDVGWHIEATCRVASAKGYQFNSHELQHAIDEMWGSLTEEDLLNIAG